MRGSIGGANAKTRKALRGGMVSQRIARMHATLRLLSSVLVPAMLCGAVCGGPLPRSTPEEQGIASGAIAGFVAEADETADSLHSFMLVRHGRVVAEGWWAPYEPGLNHELYSLSKSFTSTAVGFAVKEGKMSIDDTVVSFFPDELPESPGANLKNMRVRDLLAMSTGHEKEPPTGAEGMTVRSFLAQPVPFKPGTHFLYNTPATFMCSAIVQKVTGQTVLDYLKPRLFEPLGIEHPEWAANAEGISLGGYGLSVRTEDIAKLGQLYLQKGQWNGQQLLPARWVEAASARQTSNGSNPQSDWDQGYGYQFWRCRNGAYRGDGAFGQYCVVMPEQDAVIAITAGLGDMQRVLNLVWDRLLPAMKKEGLAADAAAHSKLKAQMAALSLKRPAGAATSPRVAGLAGKRIEFESGSNDVKALILHADHVVVEGEHASQKHPIGAGDWFRARAPLRVPLSSSPDTPIATAAAWESEDVLKMKIAFTATPYVHTWTLKLIDEEAVLERESNVSFGSRRLPTLRAAIR
jgi:CubicO group peptidase (beta-lactamase class C family)